MGEGPSKLTADRAIYAGWLAAVYGTSKVIVCGGHAPGSTPDGSTEAEIAASIIHNMGYSGTIIEEGTSRTTVSNLVNVATGQDRSEYLNRGDVIGIVSQRDHAETAVNIAQCLFHNPVVALPVPEAPTEQPFSYGIESKVVAAAAMIGINPDSSQTNMRLRAALVDSLGAVRAHACAVAARLWKARSSSMSTATST